MGKLTKTLVNEFLDDITTLGSGYTFLIISLIFLALGQFMVFYRLFWGLVCIYGLSIIVKLLYFKKRPNNQKVYKGYIGKVYASSFPSIHSARIFFLASFGFSYFNNIILTVFLFSLATIVSFSRVYLRKHRYVDILVGALIGLLIWKLIEIL